MNEPPEKAPPIKDFEILSRFSSIKALAHRDRLAMLGLLKGDPMTAFALARALGIPPNQANYHLKVLQREGLAREAGLGKMRWKAERFYRARAHNYVVDPGLGCQDTKVSNVVRGSVEAAFLDWRRSQVLNVDFQRIAQQVVQKSLRARTGDVILVLFMPAGLELAEAIQVELRAVGAEPRPMMWSRRVALGLVERHTAESLSTFQFLDPALDRALQGGVFISSNIPQGREMNPAQMEKLPLLLSAVSRWHVSLRERRIPYLEVTLPYRGEFDAGIMSEEDGIDAFWRCLESDGDGLTQRAQALSAQLGETNRLTIRGVGGTELTLECDFRRPFIGDGIVSESDIAAGRTFESLPSGTLSFLPWRNTAHGNLFLEHVYVVGRRFRDVTFTVADGRIAEIESPNDISGLRQLIANAAGEPDQLAEVGIGLNPGAHTLSGKAVLDACMEGAVTAAFGNNELLGGDVRSTLSMILPSRSLSVIAGRNEIVRNGKLLRVP